MPASVQARIEFSSRFVHKARPVKSTGMVRDDGMILASAQRGRCGVLWTEDLNHGRGYFGVVARNPFLGEGEFEG